MCHIAYFFRQRSTYRAATTAEKGKGETLALVGNIRCQQRSPIAPADCAAGEPAAACELAAPGEPVAAAA